MLEADQIANIERAMREEHRKDLEALERLKRFLPRNGNSGMTLQERVEAARRNAPQTLQLPGIADTADLAPEGSIKGAVQRVLLQNPETQWTVQQMIRQLREKEGMELQAQKPEATVGLIFSKLIALGQAEIVRRGAGRIPNVYRGVRPQEEKEAPKQ